MTKKLLVPTLIAAVGACALVATWTIAQAKDAKPATAQEIKLPPGWTAEDMKACMLAGTPGKMHELLAKEAGEWQGKCTMQMGPDGEKMSSDCTSTVTPIMDGRYVKIEMKGDMPGMGPYHGGGVNGYDNVSKKFVSAWIDDHSTGIMFGEGELSDDDKSITWNYKFNCPLTKKQVTLKQVDTTTGDNSKTIEMWGDDPKTGKNYKMMTIEMTRK
jgi:hypothetical protein